MSTSEFDLIERYFRRRSRSRADVVLGIGDDAAILRPAPDCDLVVTMDTLVAGVHFYPETSAFDLGYKSLAVNLSDLAAMGAEPLWATLALTLSEPDEQWLDGYSRGFASLADRFDVALVGGDTTRGPLSITIAAYGRVPKDRGLRRSGAQVGDLIGVTGTLGDAALGLHLLRSPRAIAAEHRQYCLERLHRPSPRVAEGLCLRDLASSAIDISDGLAGDLPRVLAASGVGATLEFACLPVSPALACLAEEQRLAFAVCGGDDYELCITLAPERWQAAAEALGGTRLTRIGRIEHGQDICWRRPDSSVYRPPGPGYRHF
ncbi:MAG: thiamine-phosphate kinase [Gammaproteobacteria bacterium]